MAGKPTDEKTREALSRAMLNHHSIRVATTDPSLAGKLKINIYSEISRSFSKNVNFVGKLRRFSECRFFFHEQAIKTDHSRSIKRKASAEK